MMVMILRSFICVRVLKKVLPDTDRIFTFSLYNSPRSSMSILFIC